MATNVCCAGPSDDLARGKELIRAGNRDGALAVLGSITDPDFTPQALLMMAECHRVRLDWPKAIECYTKLLACKPNPAASAEDVKTQLMDCYFAANNTDKGLSLEKELLGAYPGDAWKLHYVVGRRYLWQHNYAQAVPELSKALELGAAFKDNADFSDAKSQLVNAYVAMTQWDNALPLVTELVRDCPARMPEWCLALGKCYQAKGRPQDAIEQFKKALDLTKAPKGDAGVRMIGKALLESYVSTGDLDAATALIRRLQGDYPGDAADWQLYLGRVYLAQDEHEKAASCFREVVRLSTTRWEIRSAQIYLGECLYKLGKGSEAMTGIKAYYAGHPDLRPEELLVEGAVLYHGAGDYDGAASMMQQFITEYADGPDSYGKGLVDTAREIAIESLEKAKRWVDAAAFLEGMASTRQDDGVLRCRIGDDYYMGTDFTQAIKAYRRAMDCPGLSPERRATAMYRMAMCYKGIGFQGSALRIAQKVVDLYPNTNAAKDARGSLYVWSGSEEQDIILVP